MEEQELDNKETIDNDYDLNNDNDESTSSISIINNPYNNDSIDDDDDEDSSDDDNNSIDYKITDVVAEELQKNRRIWRGTKPGKAPNKARDFRGASEKLFR